jgi:hypothetical protein
LKFGGCRSSLLKKEGQLIEMVSMKLKTPYDALCLTFHASWAFGKEDGTMIDSFDSLCGLLISACEKFLDEGKLEVKRHAHLLNGKG